MSFWKMIDALADALLDTIESIPPLEEAARAGLSDETFIQATKKAWEKKDARRRNQKLGKPAKG